MGVLLVLIRKRLKSYASIAQADFLILIHSSRRRRDFIEKEVSGENKGVVVNLARVE